MEQSKGEAVQNKVHFRLGKTLDSFNAPEDLVSHLLFPSRPRVPILFFFLRVCQKQRDPNYTSVVDSNNITM